MNYCWRTPRRTLGSRTKQLNQDRAPGLSMRFPIEPAHKPNDIESRSCDNVLEMGFLLANIARAAQTHHANGLRNGSFHASLACIERFEVFRLGALPCAL